MNHQKNYYTGITYIRRVGTATLNASDPIVLIGLPESILERRWKKKKEIKHLEWLCLKLIWHFLFYLLVGILVETWSENRKEKLDVTFDSLPFSPSKTCHFTSDWVKNRVRWTSSSVSSTDHFEMEGNSSISGRPLLNYKTSQTQTYLIPGGAT